MHQGFGGKMSVQNSVFYNNSAGSNNVEDGEVLLWENMSTIRDTDIVDNDSETVLAICLLYLVTRSAEVELERR